MAKQWYVVHAYSQYEKSVKKALLERIEREGMEDMFGDIKVPTEEVVEVRDGVKRKTERKFFPGYVLVEMDMDERSWHLVNSVPKVMGFIGSTKDGSKLREFKPPTPLSKREVDNIFGQVEESANRPKPKTLFEPGQAVRVKSGPFADFSGVVEEANYEKSRLRVAVTIFGRSTPVELEFSQVEKV